MHLKTSFVLFVSQYDTICDLFRQTKSVIPLVLNGKAAGSVAAVEDELADFSTICDAGVT